jgi:hypothetical protein
VLSRSSPLVEAEVGIFDRRHFDVAVLVNHPGTDIVPKGSIGMVRPPSAILMSALIVKYCTAALTSSSVLGGPYTLIGFVRWLSHAADMSVPRPAVWSS